MGRGPHPADARLFDSEHRSALCGAVADLSWLLSRGYAEKSALALVGDRHGLRARQRIAVRRCAAPDAAVRDRRRRQVAPDAVAGQPMAIDGFNALITVEAALAGGIVLIGRDGAHRDMASVHGSYRRVETTQQALQLLAQKLAAMAPSTVTWYFDRPVSNSGRLAKMVEAVAPPSTEAWAVELVFDPDPILAASDAIVASCDATILDACGRWVDLPGAVIEDAVLDAWIVNLA